MLKIVLRKMDNTFNWVDASGEIEVSDTQQAMELVYAKEDSSGGRDSYNYRVVSQD